MQLGFQPLNFRKPSVWNRVYNAAVRQIFPHHSNKIDRMVRRLYTYVLRRMCNRVSYYDALELLAGNAVVMCIN